jgi:hypothetical protein
VYIIGVLRLLLAAAACAPIVGCGGSQGSQDFAGAMRSCIGEHQMSQASSSQDLAFATADARTRRVEAESGGGQMRSGDEMDWTFAVPSRRHPEYVVLAVVNNLVPYEQQPSDVKTFAIAVRHPERFDRVLFVRGPRARTILRQIDTCIGNEIVMR